MSRIDALWVIRYDNTAFWKGKHRKASNASSWLWLVLKGVVTMWFWLSAARDQLVATGSGEAAASWMIGGILFLSVSAAYQFDILRQDESPSLRGITLFTIQSLSALGNLACLVIFAVRRWSWTTADTVCVIAMVSACLVAHAMHAAFRSSKDATPFWLSAHAPLAIGIAGRSVPRIFLGVSFFSNNTMTSGTIVSGCLIAAIRLASLASNSKERKVLLLELVGNVATQVVLTACWLMSR